MWLVVGLGNPGAEYAATRHNIGAMAIEHWASSAGTKLTKSKQAQALTATVRLGDESVLLAFPTTFMNASGGAVKALLNYYKVELDHLIVIHDEIDLDFARLRVKFGGGDNGHNGLRSIRSALSGEYFRARLGVGRPDGPMDPAAYVLKNFSKSEQKDLAEFVDRGVDAVQCLISSGLEQTQGRYNG